MERLSICVDVGSRNVINGMPQLLIFTKFQIARRRRVHANVKSNLFTPHIRVVVYFDYIHIEKRGKTNENSPNVINSPPVCSWWWYSLMMTTQQKLFLTTFYQLPLLHTHTLSLNYNHLQKSRLFIDSFASRSAKKERSARLQRLSFRGPDYFGFFHHQTTTTIIALALRHTHTALYYVFHHFLNYLSPVCDLNKWKKS